MNVTNALLLAGLAGLATSIGSVLGIAIKNPGPKFLTIALGFSAGVMILVSFMELLQSGIQAIGTVPAYFAFFVGLVIMFLIDILIPHEYEAEKDIYDKSTSQKQLVRAGLFVALGIAIHNIPEGLATFVATMQNFKFGVAIAIAVAIHNIPEGLAISVPVYAATKSRAKAFWLSFFSGFAELLGACLAAIFLMPFLNPQVLGFCLALVGGIMVFISIDELLPISRSYGHEHLSILGFVAGMLVMAISLWMVSIY